MAKPNEISDKIEKAGQVAPQKNTLEGLLQSPNIRKRFEDMLDKRAAGFISSIISATSLNPQLKVAEPMSVVSAAAIAASLDLPINQNLGFAAIVPYNGKATFQMMAKGFVQLGMRSGQYQTLNYTEVYEGELVEHDRFTGDMKFDATKRKSGKVVGFVAYERLLNGFEKYFYMTMEEVMAHGRKYSKSFDSGLWGKVPSGNYAMPLKTVIKLLLSKFGVLSIEMQTAIQSDQAVIKEDGSPEYVDNVDIADAVVENKDDLAQAAEPAPRVERKESDTLVTDDVVSLSRDKKNKRLVSINKASAKETLAKYEESSLDELKAGVLTQPDYDALIAAIDERRKSFLS